MEPVRFEDLGVDERILRAVTEMGFEEATPIQAKAIPEVMTGQDIIGQAQTGTGKTASFGIPMLQKVDPKNKHVQALSFARQESWPFSQQMRSVNWRSLCMVLKYCRFMADRIL